MGRQTISSASLGDRIEVEYFLWDATTGLTTRTATFTLERVRADRRFRGDRRLAPEYPGITEATSLGDWDPPFPVDLSRIRPQDEEYWNDYRTTPKAFIAFERGRAVEDRGMASATSMRMRSPTPETQSRLPIWPGRRRRHSRRSCSRRHRG